MSLPHHMKLFHQQERYPGIEWNCLHPAVCQPFPQIHIQPWLRRGALREPSSRQWLPDLLPDHSYWPSTGVWNFSTPKKRGLLRHSSLRLKLPQSAIPGASQFDSDIPHFTCKNWFDPPIHFLQLQNNWHLTHLPRFNCPLSIKSSTCETYLGQPRRPGFWGAGDHIMLGWWKWAPPRIALTSANIAVENHLFSWVL